MLDARRVPHVVQERGSAGPTSPEVDRSRASIITNAMVPSAKHTLDDAIAVSCRIALYHMPQTYLKLALAIICQIFAKAST